MPEGEAGLPPMAWNVDLVGGVRVVIIADATYVDGQDRVFELVLDSQPVEFKEVARVPVGAIIDFESSI